MKLSGKIIMLKCISAVLVSGMIFSSGTACLNVQALGYSVSAGSGADVPSEDTAADEHKEFTENLRVKGFFGHEYDDRIYTDWWYSEKEDCYFIFLPSGAERKELGISYSFISDEYKMLYFNGEAVISGEKTDILDTSDEFEIYADDTRCGRLKIMQSELGCAFVSITDSTLENLNKNKSLILSGNAVMLSPEGNVEYSGGIEKISGHGNSSWNYGNKKSYNIKLENKSGLFGMGKSKKWALISNQLDQSMLRNKTALDISKNSEAEINLDFRFIELYADGEYRGTYQLTERAGIEKHRINITDLEKQTEEINEKELSEYPRITVNADSPNEYIEGSCKYYDIPDNPEDITGGYLLEFQIWNRYGSKADSGFVTTRGQAVEVKSPKYASEAQMFYIRDFVQDFEDAVYSPDGYNSRGKHYSEYIDTDSLIRDYIVQEIAMNIDGTFASFYLWKDSDTNGDGKLHFGPVWDFDLSMGNFRTYYTNGDGVVSYAYKPDNLFVANFPVNGFKLNSLDKGSGRDTCGYGWVNMLFRKTEFQKRVREIYSAEFDDNLRRQCSSDSQSRSLIEEAADSIRNAAEMNNVRWNVFGRALIGSSTGDTFDECTGFISDYLKKRHEYLHSIWFITENDIRRDLNNDGKLNSADFILLKKWLINADEIPLSENADVNADGTVNIFDLMALMRMLSAADR